MINKLKRRIRGFTLVETLVAVLLLTTAIAGPLTIASKSLIAAVVAKDQVTAFFLAQDAVEFVRFARDTNRLLGADWLDGAGGTSAGINLTSCAGATGCYIDSTSNNPTAPTTCGGSPCIHPTFSSSRFICYEPTTNRFRYGANAACTSPSGLERAPFARQITITPATGNPDERILTVTVSWQSTAGPPRSIIVRENIFNWQ